MELSELKQRRFGFVRAAHLVTLMEDYLYMPNDKSLKSLELGARNSMDVLLPFGGWGNAIALALETNNYVVAEYLINNANRLELKTEYISHEGTEYRTLRDEYINSQLTFYETEPTETTVGVDPKLKQYFDAVRSNIRANEKLSVSLGITPKEKEDVLQRKLKGNN